MKRLLKWKWGEILILVAIAIMVLIPLVAQPACSYVECEDICEAQKASRLWTFTQGCYCVDEKGAYNPKDER